MNVEIGTESPIFLFWEYLFSKISVFCLCSACIGTISQQKENMSSDAVPCTGLFLTTAWPVVSIIEKLTELSHLLYTVTLYHPKIPQLPSAVVDTIAFALTSSYKGVSFFLWLAISGCIQCRQNFFCGLECVGQYNVAQPLVFLRDVWIRTQRAAVVSRRATNLATHLPATWQALSLFKAKNLTRKPN